MFCSFVSIGIAGEQEEPEAGYEIGLFRIRLKQQKEIVPPEGRVRGHARMTDAPGALRLPSLLVPARS